MQKDNVGKTIGVAAALCIVCSIFVSSAAVILKPLQEENKALDLKKNLLSSAGLIKSDAEKAEIEAVFKKIEIKIVDLETGKYVDNMDPEKFDQVKAGKDPKQNKRIDSKSDLAKIKFREKYSKVFLVKENNKVSQIVLPIRGKGLWSTMWGFVSIKTDTKTVVGLSFYQHGETPGLGGEVDNLRWKASWIGKELLGSDFKPKFSLSKISVTSSTPDAKHKIDALAGATLTSNGVSSLIHYWFGNDGFGPYLSQVRANGI